MKLISVLLSIYLIIGVVPLSAFAEEPEMETTAETDPVSMAAAEPTTEPEPSIEVETAIEPEKIMKTEATIEPETAIQEEPIPTPEMEVSTVTEQITEPTAKSQFEYTIDTTWTIHGRMINSKGNPIPNIPVLIIHLFYNWENGMETVTTDEDGYFTSTIRIPDMSASLPIDLYQRVGIALPSELNVQTVNVTDTGYSNNTSAGNAPSFTPKSGNLSTDTTVTYLENEYSGFALLESVHTFNDANPNCVHETTIGTADSSWIIEIDAVRPINIKYEDKAGNDIMPVNAITSATVDVGAPHNMTVPSISDYVYTGWKMNDEPKDNTSPNFIMPFDDVIITLVYGQDKGGDPKNPGVPDGIEDITITKSFKTAAGSTIRDSEDVYVNLGDTFNDAAPAIEGYIYDHYEVDGIAYAAGAVPNIPVVMDESVDFTVTYVYNNINTYKLIYDVNGGTGDSRVVTGLLKQNGYILDTSIIPTHKSIDGKHVIFIGWSEKRDSTVYGKDETPPMTVSTVDIVGNKTVYAVWGYAENGNESSGANEEKHNIPTQGGADKKTYGDKISTGDQIINPNKTNVDKTSAVKTGDNGNLFLWTGLIYLSLIGIIYLCWRWKYREKNL